MKTVKAARCAARKEGTGALCVLPDGHACPHRAAGEEWASEHSAALIENEQNKRRLEAFFRSFEIDADLPQIRHTSQFLLDELKRYFPHLKRTPPKITLAP